MTQMNNEQSVPGIHNVECLCSDCKGARAAREAAERRARREAIISFATWESPWEGDGWRN